MNAHSASDAYTGKVVSTRRFLRDRITITHKPPKARMTHTAIFLFLDI